MTKIESEKVLEEKLIDLLSLQGYERIVINNEADLLANFRIQFEKHNGIKLSDNEFKQVTNALDKGNSIFNRSQILRDLVLVKLDNGEDRRLEFMNTQEWCQNIYQVTHQVTMEGKFKNRYDVTLLINGLPLVQVELKRRGIELKEAFNQIERYSHHSYKGLYLYIQLFVVSNGENTKYFTNNRELEYKQSFYWTDKNNNRISQLEDFAIEFLEKCHVSKMIAKYIVLNETNKNLMVLRPYQYYAVEAIIDRVENTEKNGYIWHTTGSGKTLTSFKVSQILTQNSKVDKVVFVVDRNDLDYQTMKEFNSFSKGSVDGTSNTNQLVIQLLDTKTRLIITTIQKLNTAISKARYQDKMDSIKENKYVFIFDECHRSQFGDTHKKIVEYFPRKQMFGFTGTPIFADNSNKGRTTEDLFDKQLHQYIIQDAISDENVLGFSVEYIGKYQENLGSKKDIDIQVEDIDTKEFFESEKRIDKVVDYILGNHNSKTYNKDFQGIFAVSSVDTLIKYYDIFKKKQESLEDSKKLKIATIFSFAANEDMSDKDGICEIENINFENEGVINENSRDRLESYMADYNLIYGTNFSTKIEGGFNGYFVDIAQKVKDRKIDLLLVVNMFLTGFDSKYLNTLYVDKNLKYHGLIQAFSRTNRILGERKTSGNIVCFRNLKERVDEAIRLFSNADASGKVLMKPYEDYVREFNETVEKLKELVASPSDVDDLISETDKADFIQIFRNLIRVKNRLEVYTDFNFNHLDLSAQEFTNYSTKYLDLYDFVKNNTEKDKVSILEELDFELELIRTDKINVDYILMLLSELDPTAVNYKKDVEFILNTMESNENLRSKRELIKEFIEKELNGLEPNVEDKFIKYVNFKKTQDFSYLIEEENLDGMKVEEYIEDYAFSGKKNSDLLKESVIDKLGILEKRRKINLVIKKVNDFIERYSW